MKTILVSVLMLTFFCPVIRSETKPLVGVHLLLTSGDKTEQLTKMVEPLAQMGLNAIIAEINYGYQYKSHPELAQDDASSRQQIQNLAAECKKHNIRLIPQFQCLGHQSWSKTTYALLTKYPQLDETPGKYPDNKGIYCRSWCPLHPEVNPIVFDLMDELIEAFDADALHAGMDETFIIADDDCPRCKGKSKAELFAKAVNDYHEHIVGKHKIEMMMWGDRLIDASKIKYGSWEASANGTASAVDLIPKDIVICDWHYEPRQAYESVAMFLEKGFKVWPASWKKPDAAKALIDYSIKQNNPKMLGHLNTTWGAVAINKLTEFEPLKYSTTAFGTRQKSYLADIKQQLQKTWPQNRTINIVCHGHSVPAGYFNTPKVDTFNAYPYLLHKALNEKYPDAVINVIVTAIGGESSDSGAARFETDVLNHNPDVITIDYALNDRRIGLEKSKQSLEYMIEQAKAKGIKLILLTPTGDLNAEINNPDDPLNQQSALIRELAQTHNIALVDSLARFKDYIDNGGDLKDLMSQVNHPNRKGHQLVADALMKWF